MNTVSPGTAPAGVENEDSDDHALTAAQRRRLAVALDILLRYLLPADPNHPKGGDNASSPLYTEPRPSPARPAGNGTGRAALGFPGYGGSPAAQPLRQLSLFDDGNT